MSPSLSKSIQPSPRNMSRYIVRRRLRHLVGHISGTGSVRHNPFKLDQRHLKSFQMSPSLSKSVQPSLRNKSKIDYAYKKCTFIHTHIHTYIHTQTFSDLVELSRMVYNTRGLRGSDQKLVFPVILYPFYRERQKCWQTELQGNQSHHTRHLYGLFPRHRMPLAEENFV